MNQQETGAIPADGGTSDYQLSELAEIALKSSGFRVRTRDSSDSALLIAEDDVSIVGVAATTTIRTLVELEPALSTIISELRKATGYRPKDAYSVLITTQQADSADSQPLFEIAYNLRHVRRIVRAGVEPTVAGVRRALRPVLQFSGDARVTLGRDPMELLRSRLLEEGIDAEFVDANIGKFERTRHAVDLSDEEFR